MSDAIIVGDVGGTNVRFAEVRRVNGKLALEGFDKFTNTQFDTFYDALAAYLSKYKCGSKHACFALAGPIRAGEVQLTNYPVWHVSEQELSSRFGFADPLLINDFAGMARSVPEYGAGGLDVIVDGHAVKDVPMVVTGPGTGLGVATLLPSAQGFRVLSGEGGHTAYAPRTALEFQLATLLLQSRGYVSNELVCSGSGLPHVYRAFCQIYGRPEESLSPQDMRERADAGDDMFQRLIEVRALCVMGAAGDLALTNGALGGVVLAGGVTERIVDYLRRPSAVSRFRDRGPMSGFLKDCPVFLLADPHAPLLGAGAYFEQERNA
jgi:glucokinase